MTNKNLMLLTILFNSLLFSQDLAQNNFIYSNNIISNPNNNRSSPNEKSVHIELNCNSLSLPNIDYTLIKDRTYKITLTVTGTSAIIYFGGQWSCYGSGTFTDYITAKSNSGIFKKKDDSSTITSFEICELEDHTTEVFNNLKVRGNINSNGNISVPEGRHISLGFEALHNSEQGTYGTFASNIAIGYRAGYSNTKGHVTAIGYRAGEKNTGDGTITAMGKWALLSNTTGHASAFGNAALRQNTTSNSHAFGDEALAYTTTNDATGFGYYAGHKATNIGTYFGTSAGHHATTGQHTLFGHRAGYNAGSAQLTAIGHRAAENVIDGSGIYIGHGAGYSSSIPSSEDTNIIAIGDKSGKETSKILNNSVALGYNSTINKSDQITLGNVNHKELRFWGYQTFMSNSKPSDTSIENGSIFKGTDGNLYYKNDKGIVSILNQKTSIESNKSPTNTVVDGTELDEYLNRIGDDSSDGYKVNCLNKPPSSPTDKGTPGEIRYTTEYIYICTAKDTWKRTSLSSW